jgi:hypothetical protein
MTISANYRTSAANIGNSVPILYASRTKPTSH